VHSSRTDQKFAALGTSAPLRIVRQNEAKGHALFFLRQLDCEIGDLDFLDRASPGNNCLAMPVLQVEFLPGRGREAMDEENLAALLDQHVGLGIGVRLKGKHGAAVG
jgi:hypothetical protein